MSMEAPKAVKYVAYCKDKTSRTNRSQETQIDGQAAAHYNLEVGGVSRLQILRRTIGNGEETRLDHVTKEGRNTGLDGKARTGTTASDVLAHWRLQLAQTTRTLRIFLSHTVSDQAWQTNGAPAGDAPNFEGGQGIPAWAFKIEGRVLEVRVVASWRR